MITTNPVSRVRSPDLTAAWRHIDAVLCVLVVSASILGSMMIYSATREKDQSISFIDKHIVFVTLGVAVMIGVAAVDYVKLRDWASEAIIAFTAGALRPLASNSSRSKFEETWISMDGDIVGFTAAAL